MSETKSKEVPDAATNGDDPSDQSTMYNVASLKTSVSETSPLPSPPIRDHDDTPLGTNISKPLMGPISEDSLRAFQRKWRIRNERLKHLKGSRVECGKKVEAAEKTYFETLLRLKASATEAVNSDEEYANLLKIQDAKKVLYDDNCRVLMKALKDGRRYDGLARTVNGLQADLDHLETQLAELKVQKEQKSDELTEVSREYAMVYKYRKETMAEYNRINGEIEVMKSQASVKRLVDSGEIDVPETELANDMAVASSSRVSPPMHGVQRAASEIVENNAYPDINTSSRGARARDHLKF